MSTQELQFTVWMRKVDDELQHQCGFTSMDLPDKCYRDMWEDGLEPADVADQVLAEEGYT